MHTNSTDELDEIQVHVNITFCFSQLRLVLLKLYVLAAAENKVQQISTFETIGYCNCVVFLRVNRGDRVGFGVGFRVSVSVEVIPKTYYQSLASVMSKVRGA